MVRWWTLTDWKQDRVGPFDNRPCTDNLHHFVKKQTNKKTCDMWHMTCDMKCDMWHVKGDTWHMKCDMLWGVSILSKFHLPSSYGSLDQAKISSEKFTYAWFRPELCPKLLFGILIRKMPRKIKFFLCPPVPLCTNNNNGNYNGKKSKNVKFVLLA